MNKLTKAQLKQKQELYSKLCDARDEVESAIDEFNGKYNELFEEFQQSLDKYNNILQSCREFCETVAESINDYYDGRSDKWQEEKGDEYQEWASAFEEFQDVSDLEVEKPVDFDYVDFTDSLEAFDMLPEGI